MIFAVSPETLARLEPADLPKKTSLSSSSYCNGPNFSERPHLVTMDRAILVARSMSLDAPVVTPSNPRVSSSAMRPPNKPQIWLDQYACSWNIDLLREETSLRQSAPARNDRDLYSSGRAPASGNPRYSGPPHDRLCLSALFQTSPWSCALRPS